MAYFRGVFIPSLSATLNVAWETLKSKWPENSPCMEMIRNAGGVGGGGGGGGGADTSGNFRSIFSEKHYSQGANFYRKLNCLFISTSRNIITRIIGRKVRVMGNFWLLGVFLSKFRKRERERNTLESKLRKGTWPSHWDSSPHGMSTKTNNIGLRLLSLLSPLRRSTEFMNGRKSTLFFFAKCDSSFDLYFPIQYFYSRIALGFSTLLLEINSSKVS